MLAVASDLPYEIARHPLTALAEGMVFTALRAPESDFDIEQAVFTIAGALDCERLHAAWQTASDRHDALRSSIAWEGDRPHQIVWSHAPVPFAIDAHIALDPDARRRVIDACVAEERARGISPWSAPLQRVRVLQFGPADHAIVWTNHHAILDGRSRAIVLRDIVDAYRGIAPAAPPVPYAAHIAWLEAAGHDDAEPFWRTYLAGFHAPTPLPVSARPYGTVSTDAAVASGTLDATETAALAAFASDLGTTPGVLVQAAWALVLARHANERDVVFGVVRAARHSSVTGARDMVGLLIATLPARVVIDEHQPLRDWLAHVHRQSTALRGVEQTPLRAIAAWSELEAPAPLFESLVVYERETLTAIADRLFSRTGALRVTSAQSAGRPSVPLVLAAAGSVELALRVQGNPDRYTPADARRLLGHVMEVLRGFPAAAGGVVGDVSLVGDCERTRVLRAFNTTSAYPRTQSVWELFCARAAQTPSAVALQLGARTMDYRTLERNAARIAAHLRAGGIGSGAFVGVCVERSFEMVATLLGILAAGAASIALDPTHPPQRIAFMIGDSGVRTILAQAHLAAKLGAALAEPAARAAQIRTIDDLLATRPIAGELPVVRPDDPAHVMYTSGSTGMPKGAVLPHRAIVRTVCGARYLRFAADETFFSFVPLTFDVAILEIWGPLLAGGRLVLCPPELPSLDVLARAIEDGGVTTLWLTTALFEQMVDEQLAHLRGLRQLIVGGDVMSPSHARRALAALPGIRLLNVYGPTEAAVLITAFPIVHPPAERIPLGAPIANAPVYVLDAQQRPVGIGVPGEIYTGGDGVGLGYLNRPELSAQRFLPDPFCTEGPGIMYRSGDLARWRDDGTLDFLGRADDQVKIRGVRIELAEIETTLTDHPAVREAVVVARSAAGGAKHLIAYIAARDDVPVTDDAIMTFLATRLPEAMQPARLVRLASLPRTATGKFDRGALPAPEPLPDRDAAGARRMPATPAEISIAAIMAGVLGLAEIGADDDFYRFGGDSLRAMQLVARIRETFGVDLTIRDLLAAPHVAGLAQRVASLGKTPRATHASPVARSCATGTAAPLVFLHGDLIGGGAYAREITRQLDGERPVYVIAPHGTETGILPPSIRAMAAQNVAALRSYAIAGPVRIGGFCNGAIVAYEMAQQLTRAGIAVERVVLVDPVIVDRRRLPLATRLLRLVRDALEATGLRPALHRRRASAAANWLDWHNALLARWRSLLVRYAPERYRGRVVLLWSDELAPDAGRLTAAWRRVAPASSAATVPGTHLTSITRHLVETSAIFVHHVRAE